MATSLRPRFCGWKEALETRARKEISRDASCVFTGVAAFCGNFEPAVGWDEIGPESFTEEDSMLQNPQEYDWCKFTCGF